VDCSAYKIDGLLFRWKFVVWKSTYLVEVKRSLFSARVI